MPRSDEPIRILVPRSLVASRGLDGLNDALADARQGRPLRPDPNLSPSDLVALPVPEVDPAVAVEALRRLATSSGEDPASVLIDVGYDVGTFQVNPVDKPLVSTLDEPSAYGGLGKKTGHGLVGWTDLAADAMPASPAWLPMERRPVIALLDSGVRPHSWLPAPVEGQAFVINAEDLGFRARVDPNSPVTSDNFGSHWGHGTFIAGLIRLEAPAAQVLSLRIMDDNGRVSEVNVIEALEWLGRYVNQGRGTVDVVLMAFGRPKVPSDETSEDFARLTRAMEVLLEAKPIPFVCSAGNAGTTDYVVPAALASLPQSPVRSVGAGRSESDAEPYSSHGGWVTAWTSGDRVSIMPLRPRPAENGDGFASWRGTSFAAAVKAGQLAAQVGSG